MTQPQEFIIMLGADLQVWLHHGYAPDHKLVICCSISKKNKLIGSPESTLVSGFVFRMLGEGVDVVYVSPGEVIFPTH